MQLSSNVPYSRLIESYLLIYGRPAVRPKKDIVTAGLSPLTIGLHQLKEWSARQGMVLFLIVRSDQEINKTLASFAALRFNIFVNLHNSSFDTVSLYSIYEMGYKGAEVGRALRIAGPSVSQCIVRGKILVDTEPEMYQKLIN